MNQSVDLEVAIATAGRPGSTLDEESNLKPDQSGIGMIKNADTEMIEHLTKQNNVLKKSKESFLKKNEFKINKLTKKMEKMIRENEHQSQQIVEKDKQIKLQ